MKKIIYSLLFSLLFVLSSQAQDLSFGVKAGGNFSNIYVKNSKNDAKFGFNVGLFGEYGLAPDIALQSGLFFTTKGTSTTLKGVSGSIGLSYLRLPLSIAYKIPFTDQSAIVLSGGGYAAYLVQQTISGKFGSSSGSKTGNFGFNKFDAGLGLAAGLEYQKFLFDLGYEYGLTNIYSDNLSKGNNGTFYFTLGYKF